MKAGSLRTLGVTIALGLTSLAACGDDDSSGGYVFPGPASGTGGSSGAGARAGAGGAGAGAAGSPAAGASGAATVLPGDHAARCAMLTADPGADEGCSATQLNGFRRRCEVILEGFSDACGECYVAETPKAIEAGTVCINPDWKEGLKGCGDACFGNRAPTEALDRIEKCDAFCVADTAIGGIQACMLDVESVCKTECRSRLEGLTQSCAACLVAWSLPPKTWSFGGGVCDREVWTATDNCAAYCQ